MSLIVLGGSAVVPSLLLLWYVYARDRNPEPRGVLLKTFLLGALICIPVVPVATWLQSLGKGFAVGVWGAALVRAFLGAAIPEELFKYLVLRRYVWNQPAFNEPIDGVVYGATASLGFATLENILYVGEGGLGVAALRALTAVPGHAFTGVIMGAFLGRARFAAHASERVGLLAAGFCWAVLLHGAYDAFLMTQTGFALLALIVLGIEVQWGRKLFKVLRAEQLAQGDMPLADEQLLVADQVQRLSGSGESLSVGHVRQLSVVRAAPPPAEPRGTFGAWLKLLFGGLGLSFCGLWWLGVIAVLLDASDKPVDMAAKVILVLLSLIPTTLLALLFRSGVRGLSASSEASA